MYTKVGDSFPYQYCFEPTDPLNTTSWSACDAPPPRPTPFGAGSPSTSFPPSSTFHTGTQSTSFLPSHTFPPSSTPYETGTLSDLTFPTCCPYKNVRGQFVHYIWLDGSLLTKMI